MNRKNRRKLMRRMKDKNVEMLKGVDPIQMPDDVFCRRHFPIDHKTPKTKLESVRFKPVWITGRWGKQELAGLKCPKCRQIIKPYKTNQLVSPE